MAMSVVYTTVNGQVLSENRGGVVHHFVPDPLGSVVMVRDTAGNTVYQAEYAPYGDVQSETGTNPSEFGYVGTLGYVKDSASSLYVRARYLLTNLGRWLTKDPLWPSEPGFVYANAASSMWVDPSGMAHCLSGGDDWLLDPWHDWDKNCAGEHQAAIDQGFSHARRALSRICAGRSGPSANERYRKCLESKGISPSRAEQIAKCLCDIFSGAHPIMLYCGNPNHDNDDEGKNGMHTKRGRPCKITIIPGNFGQTDPDAPPFDGDTIGKAILHEFGHCCGGTHKSPKGNSFPIGLHDECMISAIHWGWGDWRKSPQ